MTSKLRFVTPSWHNIYILSSQLAKRVRSEFRPDVLLGVARGGLVPARLLSDMLDVPTLFTVGVSFYKDFYKTEKLPRITQALPSSFAGRYVLVVDDVVDTGESLCVVMDELKKHELFAKTATLYKKPWSKFTPDFFVVETDAWVVFPWEHRETMRKIVLKATSDGKGLKEVEEELVSAGMKRRLVHRLVTSIAGEVHMP
ncbi:MAG: phosphoribosyltransferase family protein [Candidatus Bathyarchaeia archaeon]